MERGKDVCMLWPQQPKGVKDKLTARVQQPMAAWPKSQNMFKISHFFGKLFFPKVWMIGLPPFVICRWVLQCTAKYGPGQYEHGQNMDKDDGSTKHKHEKSPPQLRARLQLSHLLRLSSWIPEKFYETKSRNRSIKSIILFLQWCINDQQFKAWDQPL